VDDRERLLDAIPDVLWAIDLRTQRFTYLSRSVEALRGLTVDDTLARPIDGAFTPESLARLRAVLASGAPGPFTDIHDQPCRDGSVKHVETTLAILRDADGAAVEAVGVSRDATARVRAERALRASESRYRFMARSMPVVQWAIDRRGIFEASEGLGLVTLGLRPGQVVGLSVRDVYAGNPGVIADYERALGGQTFTAENVIGLHVFESHWAPARNEADEIVGVVGVALDVTEARRLEEQYRQAQRLEGIGRLAGGIAHDFNNLLTVILGCAETLADDLASGLPATAGDVEQIRAAAERARDLTTQLLAFARKQIIAPVVLDLNAVVQRSEKLLRRVLGEDVVLVVHPDARLWPVRCDRGQIEQVLLNLAVNARDAMPRGGTLVLETRNAFDSRTGDDGSVEIDEWACLLVRDDGSGIPAEVVPHVFEPFFTTKEQGKGTGLGLATVHGIVVQNGGRVRVESVEGHGTTFEIRFPRARGAVAADPVVTDVDARALRGTETVLVVEDEPLVRQTAERALVGAGYQVLSAGSGVAALAMVRAVTAPLDLVVTDVVMPGLSGPRTVEALRADHPGLRSLFVSGYSADEIARKGELPPGIDFLPKPYTRVDLLSRVRRILDDR
jgi:PAS domain S-box-containing protein